MGPNKTYPKVLRELADVVTEPLSLIFDMSCSVWKTENYRETLLGPLNTRRRLLKPGDRFLAGPVVIGQGAMVLY